MSAPSAVVPSRLVLDAGPLIALLHAADPDHTVAVRGFQQLVAGRTRLVTPLPVVFEVFKWLLFEAGPAPARLALDRMRRSLELEYPAERELSDVSAIIAALPSWRGTLEDALVVATALAGSLPVWTLNYRDLAAFPRLHFWSPAA